MAAGKLKWSKKAIENMLMNYKYVGSVYLKNSVNKEQAYWIKNPHPAIILEENFDAGERTMKDRSKIGVDEDGVYRAKKRYSLRM